MFGVEPIETILQARLADSVASPPPTIAAAPAVSDQIALTVFDDLAAIEADWRAFETVADCTIFQTFDWHAAWQRNIGPYEQVTLAVVVGRDGDGAMQFLMPLAVETRGFVRRLTWLSSDLCDYNAPLLACDFARWCSPSRFIKLWEEIERLLQSHPHLCHDAILLEKLPETVGAQPNPFIALEVARNPSGAYLTALGETWEDFYFAKRSSATRRTDRNKRKRLGNLGEVCFVTPRDKAGIEASLGILFEQKAKSFAKNGVANIFALPGHVEFYRDLATNPATAHLVHVSRIDVGTTLVAANFGLIFRGRYYHILASYDEGPPSKFSPGAVHLRELMRYAIEHGCGEFDFTIGDEGYKRDWSDTEIKLCDLRSAATWRGLIVTLPWAAISGVKRTIKQTPFLWRLFSKARAFAGALSRRVLRSYPPPNTTPAAKPTAP